MINNITVNSIHINTHKINYKYTITGEWKKYFSCENFYVEYSDIVKYVDYSIAIIPLLGTILPLAWICNASIKIKKIDLDFFNSIPKIKENYSKMFPQIYFGGNLEVEAVKSNKFSQNKKMACFFSGGVDAFHTLISNINSITDLITIRGADIENKDSHGWKGIMNQTLYISKKFNKKSHFIKSNFRSFINEDATCAFVRPLTGDNWWHGFHHGLGVISLAAPLSLNWKKIFFASSYTKKYGGELSCASHPTIDNFIKFNSCKIIHYNFNISRQKKIEQIIKFFKKDTYKPFLRVCWQTDSGKNCCNCEKCYRTTLALMIENQNPADYGFPQCDIEYLKNLYNKLKILNQISSNIFIKPYYKEMSDIIKKKFRKNNVPNYLSWLYNLD